MSSVSQPIRTPETGRGILEIPASVQPRALAQYPAAEIGARINRAPIGILVVDSALRIRHLNARGRPMFGNVGEVVGRTWPEVLRLHWPPEVVEELVRLIQRTLETGVPYSSLNFSSDRIDRGRREHYDFEIHRLTAADGTNGVICYFLALPAKGAA